MGKKWLSAGTTERAAAVAVAPQAQHRKWHQERRQQQHAADASWASAAAANAAATKAAARSFSDPGPCLVPIPPSYTRTHTHTVASLAVVKDAAMTYRLPRQQEAPEKCAFVRWRARYESRGSNRQRRREPSEGGGSMKRHR